ncbi:MAG: aminopeptidase P family protein [Phycisphaerales bacterium]|nr:aminopeptidase P family protein [Phycisphaerales bacterium]
MLEAKPTILAGVPAHNPWLYRAAPFAVGDPAAFITIPGRGTFFILRDIELDRARKAGVADFVHGPRDFMPPGGLSADRETATAQAAAECLRREGVREVWTDRSLPMIFAHVLENAAVAVRCDPEMGVLERRSKSAREVQALRRAQKTTEDAVRFACETIARAKAGPDGVLLHDGAPLTSERLRAMIDVWLLERAFSTSDSIVAGGAQGGDCHERGRGPLRTGEPIIIDIFPMDPSSRYYGDCTRTVVHGRIPTPVAEMHAAVLEAKRAAIGAARAGATGEDVHKAACAVFSARGYPIGLPGPDAPPTYTGFVHGTGHGVGLDVHEPPLLDTGGPALVVGDCLTIEPGLYSHAIGGVRVEDMVIVTERACDNLNSIPEGLTWA